MEETEKPMSTKVSSNQTSKMVSTKSIMKVGIGVVLLAVISAGAAFLVISSKDSNEVDLPSGYELFENEKFGFAQPEDYTAEEIGTEGNLFYSVQPEVFSDARTEVDLKVLEYSDLDGDQKKLIKDGKCEELGNSIYKVDDTSDSGLVITYDEVDSYSAGASFGCTYIANAELLSFNIYEQSFYVYNEESDMVVSASIAYKQDEIPSNIEILRKIAQTLRVY